MATTLRALVMLSTLVGLPAVWIYYGPLPPGAQGVVDRLVAVARAAMAGDLETQQREPRERRVRLTGDSAAPRIGAPFVASRDSQPAAASPERVAVVSAAGPAPAPGAKGRSFAAQIEPLLARLRQLGVMEYALERWGDGGKLYRFRCEMPLSATAELKQQFEAVAADPQRSVEQVVAEVASWRLAGRDGRIDRPAWK